LTALFCTFFLQINALQKALDHKSYTEPWTSLHPKNRVETSPKVLAAAQKQLHGEDVSIREEFGLENDSRV